MTPAEIVSHLPQENCGSVPLRSVETTSTGLRLTFAGSIEMGEISNNWTRIPDGELNPYIMPFFLGGMNIHSTTFMFTSITIWLLISFQLRPKSSQLFLCHPGTTSSGGGLGELGLRTGDTIILGAGVQCGGNCSQPMLDMAKGFLGFQGGADEKKLSFGNRFVSVALKSNRFFYSFSCFMAQ